MSPKRLIVFDLNKTLIKETSWYELNLAMGMTPEEDEMLYRLGPEKEGVLEFGEWINLLAKIMIARGHASRREIEEVVLNYTFVEGAKEVVAELQRRGFTIAIITGGFNLVADKVAHELGVEHSYNNINLVFDENDYLHDLIVTWDDLRYKVMVLQSVCRRFGVHPKDVIYVGDGDNDGDIFAETTSVAVGIPSEAHEPWKQQAIESGEAFGTHEASGNAKYRITRLDELVGLIDHLDGDV